MTDQESPRTSALFSQLNVLRFIAVVLGLWVLYYAQSLFIPVAFALLTALLLNPLVTKLRRWFIPRIISSVALMALLLAPLVTLTIELAEPAEKWLKTLPKITVYLEQQFDSISDAMEQSKAEAKQKMDADKPPPETKDKGFFSWFSRDEQPEPEKDKQSTTASVSEKLEQSGAEVLISTLSSAPIYLAQMLGGVILVLFLLVYGRPLFNVFIDEFPIVSNKRKVKSLVKRIQLELSRYITTIAIINAGLGLCTAAALYFLGVQDALLWGALVALFNFVPYVGSVISLSILMLAGLVQYGLELMALLPAAAFLLLNIIESQFITPTVLGKRMRVNPLLVILWLAIMGWLWGFLGVLLALPLLVCIKIVISQFGLHQHWITLVETDT